MDKLLRVSEYLNVKEETLKNLGVYNGFADIDSELYINPKLLKDCKIPEFKNSYNYIINHFVKIIDLLKKAKNTNKSDTIWELALNIFSFPEPNGVALGTSDLSVNGNGLSGKTAESALKKLKDILDNNVDDPMIFMMLSIIQKNIGVDRISDMIANIIYRDLLKFTSRILNKLGIKGTKEIECGEEKFKIVERPCGRNLILVPEELLTNIPPFIQYSSIQDIIDANIKVKKQIYAMFYAADKKLKKKRISQVNIKDLDKDQIGEVLNKFNLYNPVLNINSKIIVKPYDFQKDEEGIHKPIEKIYKLFSDNDKEILEEIQNNRHGVFSELVEDLINNYKFIIEKKGLNVDLYHEIKTRDKRVYIRPKHEGASHRFFIATLNNVKRLYNFDFTYEPKSSNGEVDFRFSRGNEIIVVEFKLSTNDLEDGYNKQLTEYMVREESKKAFYVIVNVSTDKTVENFYNKTKLDPNKKVIVVDALFHESPSKMHKKNEK